MRKIIRSGRFVRDLKRALKKHKNIKKLEEIVNILQLEGTLPRKYKPHKLSGNWSPKWECHIEPDWLLIYEVKLSNINIV